MPGAGMITGFRQKNCLRNYPQDGKPSVRFAIESVAADRWHDLGTVTVIRRDLISALSIALR